MRVRVRQDGFSVHAIAGTEVVLFGMDLPEAVAGSQLLGFGLERTDDDDPAPVPHQLLGSKTFAATEQPGHVAGSAVSTLEHPVQAFLWGDYTVDPNHAYTYRVLAVGGTPAALVTIAEVVVSIRTHQPARGRHGVYFNRGAAASQAYAHQFHNRRPDDVPDGRAWRWLSRGLEEAMLGFIGGARTGDRLRAAMYEFEYPAVLQAFRAAADRGVDVLIVMDAKRNHQKDQRTGEFHDVPREGNLDAISTAGIDGLVIRREANKSYIAHNKFMVLERGGQPVAVWTGSTNVTAGGIYGHSNVGHVVRDPAVARAYLDEWTVLATDPTGTTLRNVNEAQPVPVGDAPEGRTVLFSPRHGLGALDWYADRMESARNSVFFTAAFGISAPLQAVLAKDVDYLRYGLLDKGDESVELLKRDRDNAFAVGARVENAIGGWARETLTGLNGHVQYIHTKFMLIDPLSWDPLVITGSANFSAASTTDNDENMLVIRGDTRVADVYLTEFMRLFNHFEFRQRLAPAAGKSPEVAGGVTSANASGAATTATGEPTTQGWTHLDPQPGWALEHYQPGWRRTRERELFA
jgi:phosphatidylserine/phosphatidylglycerophosphate/cardiolipin synthase-like enzyme